MKTRGGKICKPFSEADSRTSHWRRLQERRQREAELDVDALVVKPSPGSLASLLARKKGKATHE
jgi:hypothetical protein